MPNYTYYCESCKKNIDITQKISAKPVKTCPRCYSSDFYKSPAKNVGMNFIGSGFYVNDYGKGK